MQFIFAKRLHGTTPIALWLRQLVPVVDRMPSPNRTSGSFGPAKFVRPRGLRRLYFVSGPVGVRIAGNDRCRHSHTLQLRLDRPRAEQ
jgi:hypothetical protein